MDRPVTLNHLVARSSFVAYLGAGFTRRSGYALALLVSLAAVVGYRWSDLLDANGTMDWLLAGIWCWLALLVSWGVRLRRDLCLIVAGLVGGAVIETWGTRVGLWHYFTDERPPLWILPAWPVAALAIDRKARWFERWLWGAELRSTEGHARSGTAPNLARWWWVYWIQCGLFVLAMAWFMRPAWNHPETVAVLFVMLLVVVLVDEPRADVALFLAGSLLGLFLEYWGTSRQCWSYHTGQVPPPVTVVAHGFASLAFARLQRALLRKLPESLYR